MSFSFSVAKRFITKSHWQSIFIVVGIAVGISVAIFVGTLIDSLQASLINSTVGSSPHISISNDSNEITNLSEIENQISGVSGITKTYPEYNGNGLLVTSKENYPVLLKGVTFDEKNDIYSLKNKIIEGQLPNAQGETVIGKELATEANIKLGDTVNFAQASGKKNNLKVVGIYDLKNATVNKSWMFSNIDTVWEVFATKDAYTVVNFQVAKVFDADKIANEIKGKINSTYTVDDWKAQNAQLLSALQGQSISSYMIQVFVLVSVLIAIASILSITVTQKSRQIGILKAIGLRDKISSRIFYWQGFVLGLFGTILGVGLGLGLFYSFVIFAKTPDGGNIVDPYIKWSMVLITALIALFVSSFAGIFPARKANKLSPIEVIRNG